MKPKKSLMRVALAALAWLVTSGLAPQNQPRITMDDLPLCRSEIAEARQAIIKSKREEAVVNCGWSVKAWLYKDVDSCMRTKDFSSDESASISDLEWYMKGGTDIYCGEGEDECLKLQNFNNASYMSKPQNLKYARFAASDKFRDALPSRAELADSCVARIWLAKKDGVPFKPTGAKQIAASAGGGTASSASASSQSFVKQATGGEGASSKRMVHNPAADAKSCVKMVQTSTSTDARISGNFNFINECDVGVEIFWCFPRPDGRCANGGTWSVSAGRGWPVLDNEASIQWGACRGFGRFVYKDDDRNFTDGKSYYCE